MAYKRALTRRIVIAFVAITLVVSGAFALSLVYVVHVVEEHLVAEELEEELNQVLARLSKMASSGDSSEGPGLPLEPKTQFYTSGPQGPAIPRSLAGSREGFSEFVDGADAFYVFQQTRHGLRHMLVKEQNEFEQREQALYSGVLAGSLFSILAASILGWLLARRVMAPVARLARQVRHRDQLLPVAPPLAPDYADDEVGQLAAAFDATLGYLRQALERERFFTGDVSHELRTPLMVIASSCELLVETGELTGTQLKQLHQIEVAGSDIQELVETFLFLARGDSRTGDTVARVTLAGAADNAMQRFSAMANAKGQDLKLIVEAQDSGSYNASFLAVVMANLLRNAIHYSDGGEVRLVLVKGGFRVEDSGIGVAAEEQREIFEPFYRIDHARGEGQGLGLSIVKRVCQHQGWAINLRPLDSAGSCFVVDF